MKCVECSANVEGKCKLKQCQRKLSSGHIGCRTHKATIERRLDEKKSLISILQKER